MNSQQYLTTKQVSEILQKSEVAIRVMVHRGQLEAYKLGRLNRYREEDVYKLIKRLKYCPSRTNHGFHCKAIYPGSHSTSIALSKKQEVSWQ